MRIKNTTNGSIYLSDMPGTQSGQSLALPAGVEVLVFDEDAEKSTQLASFLTSGAIVKLSDEEPGDSGGAADRDLTYEFADVRNDIGINRNDITDLQVGKAIKQAQIVTPDAPGAAGSYTQADLQSMADLINELKNKINSMNT